MQVNFQDCIHPCRLQRPVLKPSVQVKDGQQVDQQL